MSVRRPRRSSAAWQVVICTLAAVLSLAAGAMAYDFWLEPDSAFASKGDEFVLHLRMGDRFQTEEEQPLQKDRVARFDLFGNEAVRRDLLALGSEGQTPVARTRLESGAALVVMDRKPHTVTMDADTFNDYLEEEGLDAIAAQRTRLGQADAPAREVYTRFLKVLVQERDPTADTANTLYKRRVGKRLEILLENDPGQLRSDGRLAVKVLFEDKPLAGAKIFAYRRAKADGQKPVALTATTSAKGLAEFSLDQSGLWLVRLVHMRAAGPGAKSDLSPPQWESFWAAYTFAARFAPGAVAPTPRPSASP